MAQLEILEGKHAGHVHDLSPGTWTVGRGHEADISIVDDSVSRKHAVLEGRGGQWTLRDLDSNNGTFVDSQRVAEHELCEDTEIKFGTVRVLFRREDGGDGKKTAEPAESATPSAHETAQAPKSAAGSGSLAGDADMLKSVERMREIFPRVEEEFGHAIVGQRKVLEQLLTALAANGHCLMVGLPGLAKTLMVRTLADILQLHFRRIQFTPDLMPSDILGTDVLETDETTGNRSFRFMPGPIFTNLLLADEINRTPPKTQAALLECMQERQVTVSNHVFPLSPPFFVLATQNPLEQEGTYPLPEAQLDRFMFNIIVEYPDEAEEETIVSSTTGNETADVSPLLSAEQVLELQKVVRSLPVSSHVVKYATRLVRSSRPAEERAPDFIRQNVFCGAGPRAAQFLILGAKARAVVQGRVNVSCDDVRALALPVLRHRVYTNFTADSEGVTSDILVRKLLESVREPSPGEYGK